MATLWPERRDQLVSVALSPAGDRLAYSVGPRLSVSSTAGRPRVEYRLPVACALSPSLTWSPDGTRLAFRDDGGQGRVIDLPGTLPVAGAQAKIPLLGPASALAFIPGDDRMVVLAPSLPGQMTLRLIRPGSDRPDRDAIWEQTRPRDRTAGSRLEGVNLAVSPDGRRLACSTGTATVWVFDTATGRPLLQFDGHSQTVTGLAWIDDDRIVTAAADATLQVWCPDDAVPAAVVETVAAAGMTFVPERRTALIRSTRGDLRAWSLGPTPVQLWYRDPPPRSLAALFTSLAVSAVDGLLALVDPGSTDLVLVSDWHRPVNPPAASKTYANAKVLMLGDSGVGKSGLAMVLARQDFQPTESTHGRQIWRLPATEEQDSSGEIRDVLIWDLAGQPGYRIVHQLHLEGAALALILFDARSEIAPLDGVQYWARAVRHAHPTSTGGLTTFLVAARVDRGGINVSDQRIHNLVTDFELTEYVETSAKEKTNTDLLRSLMLGAIDWSRIPEVTSTALFAAVKQFVVDQTSSGTLLTPVDELRRAFEVWVPSSQHLLNGQERHQASANDGPPEISPARMESVFEGCIARLESAGLVKRLKFGDYVLLQPELLDAYAGAMVNAARDEPDGLGSILEATVENLDFAVPSADRALAGQQEKLLVLATLEELLKRELVLREPTEEGIQLVFPSAYRRDLPASETPRGDGVVFRFEGPVLNVYATLIVRLARSTQFTRVDSWQSAARFAAETGECTIFLSLDVEGKAELRIGYDHMPTLLRTQFERFVHAHLDRQATPGTVSRERRYSCPRDGTAFTSEMIEQVISRGRPDILCPVCEQRVSLHDDYGQADDTDQATAAMNAAADAEREAAAASAVVRGKEEVEEFDVFLCHNWDDKAAVRELAEQLRERGLRPWLDERELRPGLRWQPRLEEVIARTQAAAVIVGPAGIGPWQDQELDVLMTLSVQGRCALVPVLLPGADPNTLRLFMNGLTWVNLAATEPDPIDQLVWGITGQQPSR